MKRYSLFMDRKTQSWVLGGFLSFFFFFGMWDLSFLTRYGTHIPCIGSADS